MPNTPPNLIAGEDLYAHRFVQLDTSEDFQGLLATTNAKLFGITGPPTKKPPLSDLVTDVLAAEDGDSFQMKGEGDVCLLELGDTAGRGTQLKSDSTGRGVLAATTGTTIQETGARLLQSGIVGDLVMVQVELRTILPAAS